MAYSEEQRWSALETFIRFDHSYADTIAELGYPNRGTPGGWWREYERTESTPIPFTLPHAATAAPFRFLASNSSGLR